LKLRPTEKGIQNETEMKVLFTPITTRTAALSTQCLLTAYIIHHTTTAKSAHKKWGIIPTQQKLKIWSWKKNLIQMLEQTSKPFPKL
jgi:hypothetical protein